MDTRALVAAYNRLGQHVYQRLAEADGNIVLSPVSIGTALSMALSGARGETEREMRAVLGHAIDRATMEAASGALLAELEGYGRGSANHIAFANALLLDEELGARVKADYRALVRESYAAEVLAGISLEKVNAWASAKTMGRLPRLLERVSEDVVAILLNAMIFAAGWSLPFDPYFTKPGTFHAVGGDVTVATMHQRSSLDCMISNGLRAVRLGFTQPWLSLTIVLPDGSLSALERSMDDVEFRVLTKTLRSKPIALQLPCFRIEAGLDLASLLKKAGMELAFSEVADFSGMAECKPDRATLGGKPTVKIGQVRHGASIEVHEEGVVAAAATAVEMVAACGAIGMPVDYIPFVVDRPFLFFLIDHLTGAVLMRGRVVDPHW